MDVNFWLQKWERNEIAFHESEANLQLVEYCKNLSLGSGSRVFLPLCGKTLDIAWLLSQDYCVVGAELSKAAIEQLFVELGVEPDISNSGEFECYRANNIDIFVGDIFELSATMLGHVDAVYDRAALVALPEEMRRKYTAHLLEIANAVPQLLITYEYDQSLQDGPPFSVTHAEVTQHYANAYKLSLLKSADVPGGLKGRCAATQSVWLLGN